MRMYDLILKKRSGAELTRKEIGFIINGYMQETVPDYQVAAFAMAVFFKGMTPRETADLTMAIVRSGEQVDLSAIQGIKVDKHSTGGVGDKTTLVLTPLVAAAGVPVAKMSGRGLGHTGGTIDKLESIAGFKVSLNQQEFIDNVNRIKAAVVGQTGNLAPADKKLYALRDVTATVDSIPLIASSVMSKKIASGADAIVLDVKTGSGAFMKQMEDAFKLARAMVDIGTEVGRQTLAVVTDMDQPLGFTVGNALEVREAIATLRGEGPADLTELTLVLGGHMLHLGGAAESAEAGRVRIAELLKNGAGLAKLKEMAAAQGGRTEVIDRPELLPQAREMIPVAAPADGFVAVIQAEQIGIAAMTLGAGRETKESQIDLAVGIELKKKVGDEVRAGEPLALVYANDSSGVENAKKLILGAYFINAVKPAPRPLIHGIVAGK